MFRLEIPVHWPFSRDGDAGVTRKN